MLERRVESLEQLPERVRAVELQIVQLRDEFRGEFSALRHEIRAGDDETRRVLRDEIRAGDEQTRRILGAEMRELFEDNQRQMRILHEDVIARIAMIAESR